MFYFLYWIHPFKILLFSFTEIISHILLLKKRHFKINNQILGLSNKRVEDLNVQVWSVVFWWECVWGQCRQSALRYLQFFYVSVCKCSEKVCNTFSEMKWWDNFIRNTLFCASWLQNKFDFFLLLYLWRDDSERVV